MARRDGKTACILLAEDDPGDQELIRWALQQSKFNARLHVVSDGEEAMAYLLRRGRYADPASSPRPDLILLDLNMPKLDGTQVLEQIRSRAELRRIPVVVLTTSSSSQDIVTSYDLGCNSFITKPAGLDELLRHFCELASYWFETVTLPER